MVAYVYKVHSYILFKAFLGENKPHRSLQCTHTHTHADPECVAATHHYQDEKSSLCGL